MTRERWERIKTILGDALDRPAEERERFVREAAKDDPELLAELLHLLDEDRCDTDLMSGPALLGARPLAGKEEPRFATESVLARRYRIERFLAHGGMGEVYEAEDLELGGRVALKAVRRRVAPDEEMLALFKREIQLARLVTHANVCRIFDLVQHVDAETGEATVLLSMEFLDGQTLSAHLEQHGPFAFRDALPLIEEIAAGLQAVHDAGIIHGDLKPGNVMLASRPGEARPRAVVMDFGLASTAGQDSAEGIVFRGRTPEYSAPEQAKGVPLTPATDVYCLALIVADMLGVPRPARLKPNAERMPSGWARPLRRCLNPEPARRYHRPADLAKALRLSADARRKIATRAGAGLLIAAAAVWAGVYVRGLQDLTRGPGNRLLWTVPRGYFVNGVSPDGRYLAADDSHIVILHDLAAGKDRAVMSPPASSDEGAYLPVVSRDGRTVAYRAWREHAAEIRTVNRDGSGMRVLTEQTVDLASWSPDGKRILGTFVMAVPGQPFTSSIGVVPADGGDFQFLKTVPGRDGRAVDFSPDGKFILYTRRLPEGPRAYRMPADAKPEGPLPDGDAEAAALLAKMAADAGPDVPLAWGAGSVESPVWTPDGSRVVFVSDRSGSPALWAGRVADGKPVGEPELLKADFRNHLIGFTPDGALLYSVRSPQHDVYLANLDPATGKLTSEPRRINQQGIGNVSGRIAWLPDGKSLSFFEGRNERNVLVVHTLATGEERELPPPVGGRGYTGWFPDGRSLMTVEGGGGTRTFRRVDSQTMAALASWTIPEIPLLWGKTPAVFAPSADRMTLFLAQRDETTGPCPNGICTYIISARSIETGKDREIFRTHDIPRSLSVSTDGRELAVLAADKDHALLIAPAAGGEPRELYRGKEPLDDRLAWTADGNHVLVFRDRPGEEELWSFPTGGGPPERSVLHVGIHGRPGCAVGPDGTRIAFVGNHEKEEVWAMNGLLEQKGKP